MTWVQKMTSMNSIFCRTRLETLFIWKGFANFPALSLQVIMFTLYTPNSAQPKNSQNGNSTWPKKTFRPKKWGGPRHHFSGEASINFWGTYTPPGFPICPLKRVPFQKERIVFPTTILPWGHVSFRGTHVIFPSCKVIGMSPRLSDVDLNGSCIGFCVCCFFCQSGWASFMFFSVTLP